MCARACPAPDTDTRELIDGRLRMPAPASLGGELEKDKLRLDSQFAEGVNELRDLRCSNNVFFVGTGRRPCCQNNFS